MRAAAFRGESVRLISMPDAGLHNKRVGLSQIERNTETRVPRRLKLALRGTTEKHGFIWFFYISAFPPALSLANSRTWTRAQIVLALPFWIYTSGGAARERAEHPDPRSSRKVPRGGFLSALRCFCSLPPRGRGDLIGSDCLTQEEVIKTNACVKALTYCDLQYISLKGLREVLCLYPDYAQKFITEIQHDLTYNLREGHNVETDCESNGGIMKKLPSIKEDEEGSGSEGERSPLPKMSSLGRLGRGLRSPMRSPLRSPLLPPRPPRPGGDLIRPSSLQIPAVSFSCLQPDLSPRFVDGIEAENPRGSAQRFDFSPGATRSFPPSPTSATSELRGERDTMQAIEKLKHEMCVLSRQVATVSQELQEMSRLLKPLFHNPSTLLMSSAVTPPPSVSSLSCSPAPPLLTQHAPAGDANHSSVLAPEPPSPQLGSVFQGEFGHDPPASRRVSDDAQVAHRSAPPSLHSSPHEHATTPHPCSSSSIPSLSSSSHPSSTAPLLVDLSEPSGESRTRPRLTLSSQFIPRSCSLSPSHVQPYLQPPAAATRPRQSEWEEHPTQLSFVDEGRPSL